jgi:hypothetical protein
MSQVVVSAGQSLLDVALQEAGSLAALFALADASGVAITDVLKPGQLLEAPAAAVVQPDVVGYFRGRGLRINTGDVPALSSFEEAHDFDFYDWDGDDLDTH